MVFVSQNSQVVKLVVHHLLTLLLRLAVDEAEMHGLFVVDD